MVREILAAILFCCAGSTVLAANVMRTHTDRTESSKSLHVAQRLITALAFKPGWLDLSAYHFEQRACQITFSERQFPPALPTIMVAWQPISRAAASIKRHLPKKNKLNRDV